MKDDKLATLEAAFKAFADPTRLRILGLLAGGEICVCNIHECLGISQPTASRHLAYLRKAGLVETREQGLWNFYRLAPDTSPFHRKLLECLTACFGDVPKVARDADKARALKKSGGCCPEKESCG